MIRALRVRHRWMMLALSAAIPGVLITALTGRERPVVATLPAGLDPTGPLPPAAGELALVPALGIRGQVSWQDQAMALRLILRPTVDLGAPDLLVYWSATSPGASGVPSDAYLLGSLAGSRPRSFELPGQATALDGYLILYSLGHQERVASVPLSTRPRAP